MSLFTRAIQRTNSMAVREPAVVASGLLMLIGKRCDGELALLVFATS